MDAEKLLPILPVSIELRYTAQDRRGAALRDRTSCHPEAIRRGLQIEDSGRARKDLNVNPADQAGRNSTIALMELRWYVGSSFNVKRSVWPQAHIRRANSQALAGSGVG